MQIYKTIAPLLIFILPLFSSAQRIHYSEPERDDYRQVNFEIIGKLQNNILIYKRYRIQKQPVSFDNDMKLKKKIDLDFYLTN